MRALVLAAVVLTACVPTAERWVGTCALDDGGSLELDVAIQRTSDNTVEGTATMSCAETEIAGPFEGTDMTIGGPASRRNYTLSADDPDVHWTLYLSGDASNEAFAGECMLTWSAEADYSGVTMPTDCTGSGEFSATEAE